jgi:methionyl-tRNA synthetase
MVTNVKMWFDAERYRFDQSKIDNNRRNSYNEIDETLVLPLDRYEDFLKEWILVGHKNDWKPNVYGQVKSWIDGGLEPRAVTRDLDWGIDVPVEGAEGKKLYVWFDAPLATFLTKEWALREGKIGNPGKIKTQSWFTLGKTISFSLHHFPAMLKAEGSYILPDNVPANEFLNLEGNKLSTSKTGQFGCTNIWRFPNQQDVLLCFDIKCRN